MTGVRLGGSLALPGLEVLRFLFYGLGLDGENCWQIVDDGSPGVAGIRRAVDLAASGAEVDAAVVQRIGRHRVAEDVDVAVFLREAFGERLPVVSAGAATVDAELAFGREVEAVAGDGDDVDRFRF